jgi:predicted secreted Zn-dependent protease
VTGPDLRAATWRKSTRSGANGNCIEVAKLPNAVAIRDSKDLSGPVLVFVPGEWEAFISGAKKGEFDLT